MCGFLDCSLLWLDRYVCLSLCLSFVRYFFWVSDLFVSSSVRSVCLYVWFLYAVSCSLCMYLCRRSFASYFFRYFGRSFVRLFVISPVRYVVRSFVPSACVCIDLGISFVRYVVSYFGIS